MIGRRLKRTLTKPGAGIVHFGPGAFFRAFVAPFVQDAMAVQQGAWGIVAVSLKSSTAREALARQDYVFTALEMDPAKPRAHTIQSIVDVIVAPENPEGVVAVLADPEIKIVSLTITEKGYCHVPAVGVLDLDHPDIRHDLAHPEAPVTAIGFIVAGLNRRYQSDQPPFTVMSCDNLPDNGRLTRQVVLDFATEIDARFANWIAETVSFPSTMVDRITPATKDDDIALVQRLTGYFDPSCVVHEPFRQWVIEDTFPAGRPAWDAVGAQMVDKVENHELMKLRCLNGTHSTLAYLGYLAGYETVSDAVADADFVGLCHHLWQKEIIPTLPPTQGVDFAAYSKALMARYQNNTIRHLTWQIAMDGSQKMPQRIFGTIADCLAKGIVPNGLFLAVAGWMRYVRGVDESGREIDVRDPLAEKLRAAASIKGSSEHVVDAFLAMPDVFAPEFAATQGLRAGLITALDAVNKGAALAVSDFVANSATKSSKG